MREKRTDNDFSRHEHRIEIFSNSETGNEIRVDHLQVGNSNYGYIQFINTDRILTVTGDYGNWTFCRPFVPSQDGYVSDSYWIEKLRMSNYLDFDKLDMNEIERDIKDKIDHELEEYGYEGDQLSELKEWYSDLLCYCDNQFEYIYHAYYDSDRPSYIENEDIPYYKVISCQLLVIFDAFDEICRRLKEKEIDAEVN